MSWFRSLDFTPFRSSIPWAEWNFKMTSSWLIVPLWFQTKRVVKDNKESIEWILISKRQWFIKIKIIENWIKREILFDEDTLKVNSDWWKNIKIGWKRFKINPQKDILEYTEGDFVWAQLFTYFSAVREAIKQWKRLPYNSEDNKEFINIINFIWVHNFWQYWYVFKHESNFKWSEVWTNWLYWSFSPYTKDPSCIVQLEIINNSSKYIENYWSNVDLFASVRCVTDS